MYAQIATVQLKKDKMEEALKMGQEKSKDIHIEGLKGALVMMDEEKGKFIKIVLWESKEAMESFMQTDCAKEAMKSEFLAKKPKMESYPVIYMNMVEKPVPAVM